MGGEKLHFKTNIQLKSIIGKDLINDDNIAILELVKNSFDADAKKVEVQYLNLKHNDDKTIEIFSNKTSRLIIKDNGQGMNLVDIQNKWLNIAYSEKKSNNRQNNRMMAGAKGVGRFSCDRLGEYLNLYAKKKNSNEYFLLKIDWKKFEVDDDKQEIQSINLEYENLSAKDLKDRNIPVFNQGVLLEIIKLRSNWIYEIKDNKGKHIGWNTDKLVNLKKYLEKLINPNQAFEKNDFGIYLDAPEFIDENEQKDKQEKFIGKIENTIFDKLDFKTTSIESEIIEDGKVIFTTLKDKGQTIFWIKEKNLFYPLVKNVKTNFYYLNPYSKAFFTKQTGIQSVNYGSIFLFINGFRVPPYGEVGDDWLGLDQRKNQGTARYIGLREVVGSIEILDSNNNFRIISSREGIVKNENYFALTNSKNNDSLFFKTFRRLEKYVVDGLAWDSSIYENRDPEFRAIEKKIISGKIREEELIFREDAITKRRRIYDSIHSIISAKAENVQELYINEDLILDKIQEEKLNSEREFEQLITDFENKKIDTDVLNRILQKKAEQNIDLEKQLSDFTKYPTTEATTKALIELQHYKEANKKQEQVIQGLINQLSKLSQEKELTEKELVTLKGDVEAAIIKATDEERKRIDAEREKTVAIKEREEIKIEKEKQILFHQKLLTQEVKELLEYHHNIGISASAIEGHLINLKDDLNKGKTPNKQDLFELIENVSYETNKITSITNLATSANFNADADEIDADLDEFINQYISRVKQGKLKSSSGDNIQINIIDNSKSSFLYHFKPLEIAIVLDNLLSNSRKAKATEVTVTIFRNDENELSISFKDNGNGIKSDIVDQIFDFGFTTTSGSGLGLYHLKKMITEKYNGTIQVNKTISNGAELTINFSK